MSDLAKYQYKYPWIPWEQPITITTSRASRQVCRICIAQNGFSASEIVTSTFAFKEESQAIEHIRREHS